MADKDTDKLKLAETTGTVPKAGSPSTQKPWQRIQLKFTEWESWIVFGVSSTALVVSRLFDRCKALRRAATQWLGDAPKWKTRSEKTKTCLTGARFALVIAVIGLVLSIMGQLPLVLVWLLLAAVFVLTILLLITWEWLHRHKRIGVSLIVLAFVSTVGVGYWVTTQKLEQQQREQYRDVLARRGSFSGRILNPQFSAALNYWSELGGS